LGLEEEEEVLVVTAGADGLPDLVATVGALSERGYLDLLVEGGPTLAKALWEAGVIDRGVFYLGARLAGGLGRGAFTGDWPTLSMAREVTITDVKHLGSDLRIDFRMS
jgi:diaminohydroxyphosphoribosylaminopyrimidine deaminase/5-amino-6-(5-phosphoribosylamino)uracil reductase